MRIAFARWRSGGLFNRPSRRKRLLPKKKTSSGFEFVSGLADGASAMPAKWSRRVFSFRFYEGKIAVPVTLTSCAFRKSYPDVTAPRLSCINLQQGLLLPGFSTGRSPFPSPDMTTTVFGLLCWRDAHPLEWQLASLNGVLALPPADHRSDRKRPRPIHAFSATPHDGQRPYRTLDRIGEMSGRHCQLSDAADCQAA
jgi:hypothetical protein